LHTYSLGFSGACVSDDGLKLYRTWQMLEGRFSGTEAPKAEIPGFFVFRRVITFFIDIVLILSLLFIAADLFSVVIEPAWWL
jgi:hypothetical protein